MSGGYFNYMDSWVDLTGYAACGGGDCGEGTEMKLSLGSLFDGSGGFPLAGSLCGVTPVWASEVEPYPIAVTRSRFPSMKHLGDISKVNGGEIETVDIITFGSPCQDLSVAGKRAGLKHEVNGDEETTRSGLFMEAVRIIKEMREATNGVYPRFALWENVPGAFSSNKGEDFRVVLEELIKIVEPSADVAPVRHGRWFWADDGYCRCSECKQKAPVIRQWDDEPMTTMTYFCLHCGCKMLEDSDGKK